MLKSRKVWFDQALIVLSVCRSACPSYVGYFARRYRVLVLLHRKVSGDCWSRYTHFESIVSWEELTYALILFVEKYWDRDVSSGVKVYMISTQY